MRTKAKGWMIWAAAGLWAGVALGGTARIGRTERDLDNPHKGYMVWGTDYAAGPAENHYGATIYHVYAPWRELEAADQVFEWGRFETNHLLPILAADPRATFVLRPVADYPDGENSGIATFYEGGEPQRDFPRFLIEPPLSIPWHAYESCDGDGPGWTPDWNHPAMAAQLGELVAALGARYDGDPRVTAVQTGLLGLWGEWHQSGCDGRGPSNAVKAVVRDAYAAAFRQTPVQTRYSRNPDSTGVEFGFHEDYFPSFTAECKYGFPECSDDGDWSLYWGYANANPAASNHWRRNPISGESPLTAQKRAWSNDFDDVMEVLGEYHFTFLGPAGGHEWRGNGEKMAAMKRRLGYDWHLARVDWPDEIVLGHAFEVATAWTNNGSAPCYHPFAAEAALCGADGAPAWRGRFGFDLRELVPGEPFERGGEFVAEGLEAGTYTLRIGVLDPRTGEPGPRIQSEGEDERGRIVAGEVRVVDPWKSDRDGDGLPDEWEFRHFGGYTNAAREADADGDGQTNWEHWVGETDPTNAASAFRLLGVEAGPPPAVRFAPGSTGRVYALQAAGDLAADDWAPVPGAGPRAGAGGVDRLEETNEPPSGKYYRVGVSLP